MKFKHVVFTRTSLFLSLTRINLQLIIYFRSCPSGIYEFIQNSENLNNKCNGLYEKKIEELEELLHEIKGTGINFATRRN